MRFFLYQFLFASCSVLLLNWVNLSSLVSCQGLYHHFHHGVHGGWCKKRTVSRTLNQLFESGATSSCHVQCLWGHQAALKWWHTQRKEWVSLDSKTGKDDKQQQVHYSSDGRKSSNKWLKAGALRLKKLKMSFWPRSKMLVVAILGILLLYWRWFAIYQFLDQCLYCFKPFWCTFAPER